ncbi:MAG: hypothetical protein WCP26_13430 [Actinomycetes bacterium]
MLRRWITRVLALAVIALGLPVLAGVGPAAASPGYLDGGFANSSIINCGSVIWGNPYSEFGLMTYTGYYGDLNSSPPSPKAGDTFYVHVVVGGAGNSCAGQYAWVDLALPTGVSTDISVANPMRCKYTNTQSVSSFQACNLIASPYHPGAVSFVRPGSGFDNQIWPVPTGGTLEFLLPVKASNTVSATMQAFVKALDGNSNPWLTPNVGMYVAPNGTSGPPSIGYKTPSTDITRGSAPTYKSNALLTTGVAGTAHLQLGTTTSYGLINDPVSIPGADTWLVWDDWTPTANTFTAGQTYHWRLCFTPNSGSPVCGADQTFVAVAADAVAPTVLSVTPLSNPVTGPNAVFKVTFSEPVTGLNGPTATTMSAANISTGTVTFTPAAGYAQVQTVTVPVGLSTAGSQLRLYVLAGSDIHDAAGNALASGGSSALVTIDRPTADTTKPTLTTTPLPAVNLGSSFVQRWTASDAGGLASFRVRSRTTTYKGSTGVWNNPTSVGPTVRSAIVTATRGSKSCVEVIATDQSANSTTGTTRCTLTPFDERSVSTTGTWTKPANSSAYYASTISKSTKVGATKFLTGAKGNRVIVVAQKRPGAGKIQVLVNGVVKSTINLASTSVKNKQVFTITVPAFSNKTVTVKVLTAGTTGVWIDGFGVGTL